MFPGDQNETIKRESTVDISKPNEIRVNERTVEAGPTDRQTYTHEDRSQVIVEQTKFTTTETQLVVMGCIK